MLSEVSYIAKVLEVTFLVSFLELSPSILRGLIADVAQVELAILLAVRSLVPCLSWLVSNIHLRYRVGAYLLHGSSCRYQQASEGIQKQDDLPRCKCGRCP